MDIQLHDARAAARARIASTAPKTTYGKHKNVLLPLTGDHFIRSDIARPASRSDGPVPGFERKFGAALSEASDSPLSDAEPDDRRQRPVDAPTGRKTLPRREGADIQRQQLKGHARRSSGSDLNVPNEELDSSPRGVRSDHEKGPSKVRRPARQRRKTNTSNVAPKQKPKPIGVKRSRLPLNELILVTDTGLHADVDSAGSVHRTRATQDSISSSAQVLPYEEFSSDDGATPVKRKAKVPLASIRKRFRTPASGYKTISRQRNDQHTATLTPTGNYTKQVVGDGFEDNELEFRPGPRFSRSHPHKSHNRLIQGMQRLSLASGPLPDVDFGSPSTGKLQMTPSNENPQTEEQAAPVAEADAPVTCPISAKGSELKQTNPLSFGDAAQRLVTAQLSSISAPRRERSVSVGSEADDEDADEEEEAEDDEAADSYVDQDELTGEEEGAVSAEADQDDHMSTSSASPQLAGQDSRPSFASNNAYPVAGRFQNTGSSVYPSRRPSFRQSSMSRHSALNEVGELIDDDFRLDDMLLTGHDRIHATEDSDVELLGHTRRIPSCISQADRNSHSPTPSRQQVRFDRTTTVQPRSILKNNKPHVRSENDTPESTAANTRRNSMVEVAEEESRYFTLAKNQLDLSPTRRATIVRQKSSGSSSRATYSPIHVPYSDDFVPETSSDGKASAFIDKSHLHTLKRTSEAIWTSSAAPAPARDLKDLTRSVSKDSGTLSQAVRRRASLPFQSPFVKH